MPVYPPAPESPAELDANQPTQTLLLATLSGRSELVFFLESENYWRVVEIVEPGTTILTRREVVRFLDIEKNAVIPLGILQTSTSNVWNVVLCYDKAQISYSLLNQNEAAKLQELVTGYKISRTYNEVDFNIIFKSKRASFLSRDQDDGGKGVIQLWEWPKKSTIRNDPPPLPSTSVPSFQRPYSTASTVHTISGLTGGSSFQTTRRRELLLSTVTPPPVLVFFMRHQGAYKMFKADITDVEYRLRDSQLDLFMSSGRTIRLERLSVKKLEQWNLCAMRHSRGLPGTETLKCTYVTLGFKNCETAGSFIDSLLRLQLAQREVEGERASVFAPMLNGMLPPSLLPRSPLSSVTEASSCSSFVCLPGISSTEPLDDPLWRVHSEPQQSAFPPHAAIVRTQVSELETDRPVREVDAGRLSLRYEL